MTTLITYDEPHPYIEGAKCRVTLTADQAIRYMKTADPRYEDESDSVIVMYFVVFHRAWLEDAKETTELINQAGNNE